MGGAAAGMAGLQWLGDLSLGWVNMQQEQNAREDAEKFAIFQMKHRYQYLVNDLRAAGLNPVLAFGGGGGGATPPTGGQPVGTPGGSTKSGSGIIQAFSQAQAIRESKAREDFLVTDKQRSEASANRENHEAALAAAEENLKYQLEEQSRATAARERADELLATKQADYWDKRAKGEALGLPEKQASHDIWQRGGATAKGAQEIIRSLGDLGKALPRINVKRR